MMEQTYVVTTAPELDGVHFLHSNKCQVLPDHDLEELGTFDTCKPAFEKAAETYAPLNVCALCCPDCYEKG